MNEEANGRAICGTRGISVKLIDFHIKKLKMSNSLRYAVKRNEIMVYYQPMIELKSNKIVAVEALARWNKLEEGILLPNVFIPLAEETGLIIPIGEYVLHTACKQNKEWQHKGYPPISVSVNLSACQFKNKCLVETVSEVLTKTKLDAQWLEFELTEGTAIHENINYAIDIINKFKNMGIRIALDDFGTGYSSLNYLKELPIDDVKIDKSFMYHIIKDSREEMIIKAIIDMAHNLNLSVTAEGVETVEQLKILQNQHCDKVQGYVFGKPVPPEEIEAMLKKRAEA